jgi:hypothetical protein
MSTAVVKNARIVAVRTGDPAHPSTARASTDASSGLLGACVPASQCEANACTNVHRYQSLLRSGVADLQQQRAAG